MREKYTYVLVDRFGKIETTTAESLDKAVEAFGYTDGTRYHTYKVVGWMPTHLNLPDCCGFAILECEKGCQFGCYWMKV